MTKNPFLNYAELAITPGRKLALDIAAAGLEALAPENLLWNVLHLDPETRVLKIMGRGFSLNQGRLFVIGGGKASDAMAAALESLLGPETFAEGIVICKTRSARPQKIRVREAGHPIPDHRGLAAMAEIMALKHEHRINENDLVLCLLSGGASALMPSPAPGINLEDKQALTRLLLDCGAEIAEVNVIRKHLSSSKGGRLGRHFAPATVISLIVSDVIGNDMAAIGSGPTYPERSRPKDAMELVQRHGLWNKISVAIRRHLEANSDEPPVDDLPNCFNHIIGDSGTALEAMLRKSTALNKRTRILSSSVHGLPEIAAREMATNILNGMYCEYDVLLAAGETTPVLPSHHGRGGRNQHFAAATLLALKELSSDWVHISLGSDGSDYLPDVAGAVVDRNTSEKADARGLQVRDYLDRFDSYGFFHKIGGCLIETGPTGTNVGDLMIYMLP